MLRDWGSGPWLAVAVAPSAIRFHSIAAFSPLIVRGVDDQLTTNAAVATTNAIFRTERCPAPVRVSLNIRTSMAAEDRRTAGPRSCGTYGDFVERCTGGDSTESPDFPQDFAPALVISSLPTFLSDSRI